jgi:hypothetical protein
MKARFAAAFLAATFLAGAFFAVAFFALAMGDAIVVLRTTLAECTSGCNAANAHEPGGLLLSHSQRRRSSVHSMQSMRAPNRDVERVDPALEQIGQTLPQDFPLRTWKTISQGMRSQVARFLGGLAGLP